jgi:hypothetical protein
MVAWGKTQDIEISRCGVVCDSQAAARPSFLPFEIFLFRSFFFKERGSDKVIFILVFICVRDLFYLKQNFWEVRVGTALEEKWDCMAGP